MAKCAKRGCKAHKLKRGKYCLFHSRGMKYAGPYAVERAVARKAGRTVKRTYRKISSAKKKRSYRR